jgi:hypothetical protein
MWRSKNDLHITHRLDDYEQFFHLSAAKSCPNYRDQLNSTKRQSSNFSPIPRSVESAHAEQKKQSLDANS